jgi:predicted transcriptional regulator
MEKFGATQEMISKDLDIAQSAVSNYLNGRIPRADTLLQIADYFGTEPNALISGDASSISATPGLFGGESATMLADLKNDLAEAEASVKKIEEALNSVVAEVKNCKTRIGVAKLDAWRIEGIRKANSRRAK